ncbi:MAG: hypothetical protein IKU73_04695 [Clostridia bacterium]|nr:hypothetical protein [Clostridia bacterium]
MRTRLWALALSFILLILPAASSFAATLGPAATYDELRKLLASANEGDVVLVSGVISADNKLPLSTQANIRLSSADSESAAIHGLRLRDASIILSNIALKDSLIIDGTSHIHLASGVSVSGADKQSGLNFTGKGTLIIDRGCTITGGSESAGVSISHSGGDFFTSIEGTVQGGRGRTGGAGVVISPLSASGAAMISGSVLGGEGSGHGGHALNLYDLSGNAFVTIDGNLQGGEGAIGGDGIQLVAARDSVNVGISGKVKGGRGETYGGDALILMNAEGASSFHLSGAFSGGDASGRNAQPGTSLQLVGDSTAAHTRVVDCILEDGTQLSAATQPSATPSAPDVTPLPEITSSIEDIEHLSTPTPAPAETPAPKETFSGAATETPAAASTPEPIGTPDASEEPAPVLTPESDNNTNASSEATPAEAS